MQRIFGKFRDSVFGSGFWMLDGVLQTVVFDFRPNYNTAAVYAA